MKKMLLLSAALLASGLGLAQEVGRVLSATPILQQVGVPRQVCSSEQVTVQQPKSGAGALMGGIAGGAMGNAVGGGNGKAAATMIGIMGGAIIGDRVEGAPMAQVQNVQRCSTQTFYENHTQGYNVVYEFGGRQYTVQMPNDPGPTIALQVTPVGASQVMPAPVSRVSVYQQTYPHPMYEPPPQVIMMPGYYPRPYYGPIGVEFNFGYSDGYRGRRHRH
jgi:uncharacterized protein YcfJ